jgi:N-glycosidase YbiA
MTIYREAECAIIYRTRERFGELSNMCSGFPVEYDGRSFHSTEALYQCCRYPGLFDIQERINVKNAMLAKMKSKPPRSQTREDWNEVRVPIMEACLRLKTDQHFNRITDILAETGDLPIVEKSRRDTFWGAKPVSSSEIEGENVLGLLWMLIREEIRSGVFHTEVELNL